MFFIPFRFWIFSLMNGDGSILLYISSFLRKFIIIIIIIYIYIERERERELYAEQLHQKKTGNILFFFFFLEK